MDFPSYPEDIVFTPSFAPSRRTAPHFFIPSIKRSISASMRSIAAEMPFAATVQRLRTSSASGGVAAAASSH